MLRAWLAAFRLKTLPLSLGAIILGSWLNRGAFRIELFALAALTAILLQILSNLANDYGDFVKGTDKHRTDRQVAGGHISPKAMLRSIYIFACLSFVSGCFLLYLAFGSSLKYWLLFLALGIGSILAAVLYTIGKKAYGYYGLGDLFVFIFFGLLGVMGTAFLFEQEISTVHALPAVSYGLLCVGVLNVNNIRDIEKDILNNKITIAPKLGREGAISYQGLVLILATGSMLVHHFLASYTSLAPIGLGLLAFVHLRKLSVATKAEEYNKELKLLSIWSLGISILFVFQFFI